jgi:MFS family permease
VNEPVSHSHEEAWPSRGRAWYAVVVFMLVLMFAVIDRQIITLLVGPIKRDLAASDTQMGLLLGFAFVMFHLVLGIPIARLADGGNRRLIIGIGIAAWSSMTAACGLARHYWQLALARMGVGVGEACNGPATLSLLADFFPKERLAKAAAVLSMGFYVGSGMAMIVGGSVVALVADMPAVAVPVLGAMQSWQFAFFIVGVPSLLLIPLLATVSEPGRHGLASAKPLDQAGLVMTPAAIPLRAVLRYLATNGSVYGPMYAGMGLRMLVAFGSAAWLPTFFERTHGWTAAEIGPALGVILLTFAPLGLVAGGLLAEWYTARGYQDANLRVYFISTLAVVPTSILYSLMPSAWLALALFALNSFFSALGVGPANAALQAVTPNAMRAQVSALYLFVFNLIGFGLGPFVVAVLTDYVFAAEDCLRYSLALCAAVAANLAWPIVWLGLKPYRERVMEGSERASGDATDATR